MGITKKARAARRSDAEARNSTWSALSPEEQLKSLDSRLGKGVGAKKQRAKIAAKLKKA